MHYIAGTQIIVGKTATGKIKPGMTSQQIRQLRASSGSTKYTDNFEPGIMYTLIRISKEQEGFNYRFRTRSGDITNVIFPSISEAEKFISSTLGETLPDYNDVYNQTTD